MNRLAWFVAGWLCGSACAAPTQPTPSSPWSAAVPLADVTDRSGGRAGRADLSCLAVSEGGRAVVLWTQRGLDADELWARPIEEDGTSGAAERVQGPDRLARVADVLCGIDATGRGYASWIEYSGDESRLVVRRFQGRAWDPAAVLIDRRPLSSSISSRIRHDLAVDAGGRALVAWIAEDGLRSAVAVDGTWADAGIVEDRPFPDSAIQLAIQIRGPHAVAAYVRNSADSIGVPILEPFARFLGPTGWGAAQALGGNRNLRALRLLAPTLDERGRSTVITSRTTSGPTYPCSNRFDGAAWSPVSCLPSVTLGTTDPAEDSSGEVFVANHGADALQAVRWPPGASEAVVETVSALVPAMPSGAALSADGTSHAVWLADSRPWLGRAPRGGPWTVEVVPAASQSRPPCPGGGLSGTTELRLGADARGRDLVTWIEGDCGTATLWMQQRMEEGR